MQIKENFEIKNFTSFKIGGAVKKIFFPETQAEFTELLRTLDNYIVLGSCSNVLFSSAGFDGNVILTTEIKDYEIKGTEVFVSCGVKGPLIAQKTANAGLSGFEFMIGFPGTIGGNIFMNAGAHGQTISDMLISCCVYNKDTNEIEYKQKSEMGFGYRKSILQEKKHILLYAKFDLIKTSQEEITALMARNLEFRKSVQPSLKYPNAGSVFRNPNNDSAGRLLDKAGAKKWENENVKIWDNHANFIINKGHATSTDVLELMSKMYKTVKEMYTIELQPEIMYIGNKSKEEEELCNILYQ